MTAHLQFHLPERYQCGLKYALLLKIREFVDVYNIYMFRRKEKQPRSVHSLSMHILTNYQDRIRCHGHFKQKVNYSSITCCYFYALKACYTSTAM